ncbi:MAG TPA: 1-deoxy-D-xylulose-5-phosphate synthase [Frankiaceae bacterium]|nr:1-deoxy-D-xylulose-5-phosphate synthase [Frankiaceae bacterium]
MTALSEIRGPADLRGLSDEQLVALAADIREQLVDSVCRTGGHLGPNLGVVELTLALHRSFDSPHDTFLWDTGHQAYVHKMLTGRAGAFDTLRQAGGLSGYPSREESEHDHVENSHASTALSYADGIAKAYALRGEKRHVVAVVGDGALTGGMSWEALNNIAGAERPVVIVVNDNGRSYAPTLGGLAQHLAGLRLTPQYEQVLDVVKSALARTPLVGPPLYDALHGIKRGIKDLVQPQAMFEDLGLKYVGPVDGHDIGAIESALRKAKGFGAPVIVHCVTTKGSGYQPAEDHDTDRMHSVGISDPRTGRPVSVAVGRSWTSAFSEQMLHIGAARSDVVAITASMLDPVGLAPFAERWPDRVFDVGIAEQHAVTSAAGLAMGGLRPIVTVYATFMNRAFDQVLMDVALHKLPVVFVMDRAGVTGEDGASHNGMWDMSWMPVVPGLDLAAPRDEDRLEEALEAALERVDGPTAIRFPKGLLPDALPAVRREGPLDVMRDPEGEETALLVAYGAMVPMALEVAQRVADQGIELRVVDPRYVVPVADELIEMARRARLVVTLEDNGRQGGAGSTLASALRAADVDTPLRDIGLPREFLVQGKRAQVMADAGLSAQAVARKVTEAVARLEPTLDAQGAQA